MCIADKQLEELRSQVQGGFLIQSHKVEGGVHHFCFPSLEHNYTLGVPESPALRTFLESPEFQDALLVPVTIGVAMLDIVGFSSQPDDVQFKMIVRYQCLVHAALKGKSIRKMISIGDGTIFIFDEDHIGNMPQWLYEIDHELAGYNLDFGNDGVPQIEGRIGLHVGEAYRIKDVNGEENYIGTAVNLAQRVSTCVPTGRDGEQAPFDLQSTIYVSAAAYKVFAQKGIPQGFVFNDAGVKTVKHGEKIHVYAMQKYTDDT